MKTKMIDVSERPLKLKEKTQEYLDAFGKIPKGKCSTVNSKDVEVKIATVSMHVHKLMRNRTLPEYSVSTGAEKDGSKTIYVCNE